MLHQSQHNRHEGTLKPQPLSDAEFDRLEEILKRFRDKRAMNLEQLDGFFAALICGPNIVLPSEYLPEIWGDQIINEHVFSAQPMLEEFISLVTRHWNAISYVLSSGDVFTPLLLEDDQGVSYANVAHEHDPDPGMRPYNRPISAEQREKLIVGTAAGVMAIYHYFEAQRLMPGLSMGDSTTYRRGAPKVGRNDPCPCGSGKKFKHCCAPAVPLRARLPF